MAMTNPFDPLSEQLNTLERSFKGNPAKAQQFASIQPPTLEALTAQRVLNTHAKEKRKMQEELFMARIGNPNTTVNDDLKTQNVQLAKDITNLEMNKAEAAGAVGQQQEQARQNALNKLVAANKGGAGGLGALLNNPKTPNRPTATGVPGLPANNMRGMPTGGITAQPAMPTMKAAHGGIVAFNDSGLVEGEDETEVQVNSIDLTGGKLAAQGQQQGTFSPKKRTFDDIDTTTAEGLDEALKFLRKKSEEEKQAEFDRIREENKDSRRDEIVRRMLGFAGAETFGQGVVSSAEREQAFQRAREDRINKQLAEARKTVGISDADLFRSILETSKVKQGETGLELKGQELEDARERTAVELGILRDQVTNELVIANNKITAEKENLDKKLLAAKLDNDAKNEIASDRAEIERAYKDAMVRISAMDVKVDADRARVALMSHLNDYLTIVGQALDELPETGAEQTKSQALTEAYNQFFAKVNQGFKETKESTSVLDDLTTSGIKGNRNNNSGNRGSGSFSGGNKSRTFASGGIASL